MGTFDLRRLYERLFLLIHHIPYPKTCLQYLSVQNRQLEWALLFGPCFPCNRGIWSDCADFSHLSPVCFCSRLSLQISTSARSTTEAASTDVLTPGDPTTANATQDPVYMWTGAPASVSELFSEGFWTLASHSVGSCQFGCGLTQASKTHTVVVNNRNSIRTSRLMFTLSLLSLTLLRSGLRWQFQVLYAAAGSDHSWNDVYFNGPLVKTT